jgi:tetratricopeptide (TPR) repeat protein
MSVDSLKKAITLHQDGKFFDAKHHCNIFLKKNPNHFNALLLMGIIHLQLNEYSESIVKFKLAEKISRDDITLLMNLSVAYQYTKNFNDSLAYINKILKLSPKNSDAYNNLGNIYKDSGDEEKSIASFELAIKLNPANTAYIFNKANAFKFFKKFKLAIQELNKISNIPEFYLETRLSLINIFKQLNDHKKIIKICNEALLVSKLNNNQKELILEELITSSLSINELKNVPQLINKLNDEDYSKKFYNALLLVKNKNNIDAKKIFKNLLITYPNRSEVWHNLGEIYFSEQNIKEAKNCFTKSISLNSNFTLSRISLGLCYLHENNFKEGFNHFLSYQKTTEFEYKYSTYGKQWNGEDENVNTCIYLDQGIGDSIFFSKLIAKLNNFKNNFFFVTDPRLIEIYKRSFDSKFCFLSRSELNNLNTIFKYSSYGSFLPKIFINKLSDIKFNDHFLIPQPWKTKIIHNEPIVGISWFSSNNSFGRQKSIDLDFLISQLKNKYKYFVSLQYDDTQSELLKLSKKYDINFINHGNDNLNNIEGLLSLINICAEVYSISNTTIHLAGSIGKKSNLLLPFNYSSKSWYWNFKEKNYSLWYPCVKVIYTNPNEDLQKIKII